jgi:hypothetical protein
MKIARLTATFALLTFAAACATERVTAPTRAIAPTGVSLSPALLPLLYVVDGVRLPRDRVPELEASQVAKVEIIKGRVALQRFGADAAYGVILITTRQASAPQ